MTRRSAYLSRVLSPSSVAVVGGQAAATVIEQCRHIGYQGTIYAVNPTRDELGGVPCVASLDALPAPPDACFLGVDADLTIEHVNVLADMGAGGAVCYASGYSEAGGDAGGSDGLAREARLVSAARSMPVVGPNCHGFINFLDGVALWPDHFGGRRVERGPALLVQSGNMGINLTFEQRELRPAYVIAMGNNAVVGVHHYLHALLDDPRVTAIGLHLEAVRDVDKFSHAARRALKQRVPIVALKSGSSTLGAQMALSHTRSMSSPDELVSLFFARFGIARCRTLPEFVETLKFVATGGVLRSQDKQSANGASAHAPPARLVSMSCSGGEAAHMADLSAACRVAFPALAPATQREVSEVLGDRVSVSNPLDYHTYAWGDLEALTRAFTALFQDRFDCALLVLDYPSAANCDDAAWQVAERALIAAAAETGTRVVIVSSLPENFPPPARARVSSQGVAPMQGMAECLQAAAHARQIGHAQDTVTSRHILEPARPVSSITQSTGPRGELTESQSKAALRAFGVRTPASLETSVDDLIADAPRIATRLGFPLVLKASGEGLSHKSELNGVRLHIQTLAELVSQAEDLRSVSENLLVERMIVDPVAELLVGVRHENEFGQVMTLGSGGVLVELWKDRCELLWPAPREDVREALLGLKVGRLLEGYRGGPTGDIEAALNAIELIGRFAQTYRDRLVELEVNPLLVRASPNHSSADGQEHGTAVAVDALMRFL